MEISGIEVTLQRIQSIERNFQTLMGNTQRPKIVDSDFQNILDAVIENPANTAEKPSNQSIDELISKYSEKNGLDEKFVKALIRQESGFQPNAKSHAGAMGLMQLMPGTAKELGVTDAFNPEQNIMGGTKYIGNLLKQYGGNKELALAAYNAGPGAVKKYGGIPPYTETQNYVKKVLSNYQNYQAGGLI